MSLPGRLFLLLLAAAFLLPLAAAEAQTPRGPELAITAVDATSEFVSGAAVAANGDFLLAWPQDPPAGPSRVRFRLFRADGTPRSAELGVGTPPWDQLGPRVAMKGDGRFVIVWTENVPGHLRVLARRFDAAGKPLGQPFRLTPTLLGNQSTPDVAIAPNGSFVAVWESDHTSAIPHDAPEIFARRFDALGRPRGPEFQVNTTTVVDQIVPRVEIAADGDFVVVWLSYGGEGSFYDVTIRRFAANGVPLGEELALDTGATFTASQVDPAVAMAPDGSFEVVCTDFGGDFERDNDPHGFPFGIRGQRYTADGAPVGDAVHVNGEPSGTQQGPDVSRRAGGFFVVWLSQSDSDSPGIFGRRLAEDGTPTGPDIQIAAERPQQLPAVVALNAAGRGVVAWSDYDPTLKTYRVLARRVVQKIG
jgi:hypothetical protein